MHGNAVRKKLFKTSKSNLERWRTEEKYNTLWREEAIEIRIVIVIPFQGWRSYRTGFGKLD